MIDTDILQQNILSNMYSWQGTLEFEQKELFSKWASFCLAYFDHDIDEQFLVQRKESIARFYIEKSHIAKLFDINIAKKVQMNKNGTQDIDLIKNEFYPYIIFWSKLMQQICALDIEGATKNIMQRVENECQIDKDIANEMNEDLKLLFKNTNQIIGTEESLQTCQRYIAPIIEQNEFAITKNEDMCVSASVNLIKPLAEHLKRYNNEEQHRYIRLKSISRNFGEQEIYQKPRRNKI